MSGRRTGGVAIVGLGAAFASATDADSFWRLVVDGRDAAAEPPPGRWLLDPARAYDPEVPRPDRVYTTRAGFLADDALDANLDGLDVDPALVARLDPCFRLALRTAAEAWRSARTEAVDRSRVGVIFGHIVLPTETTSAITRATIGREIERALGVAPSEPDDFEPRNAFPAGAPARMVRDALGLGGSAYTLDAACASSLYAIKLACDELLAGRADAMLAGGVSRPDALYTQMGFSQLRALSPKGRAAPFDAEGDGLIVGEGGGFFVLKRLEDAVAQGDAILGVIRGVGLSNDLRGDLLAPATEGQLRAMRAAYEQAGWSPGDVDLIECHATGTPLGDAVEFESLRTLWSGEIGRAVLGSVKSNVGHALTAAGAAGLWKVLLAFRAKTLPPIANHREPSPKVPIADSPFRILQAAEPWPETSGRPRRAAISGFGFGGINAHLLIEEWDGEAEASAGPPEAEPVAIVGLAARWGAEAEPTAFAHRVLGGRGPIDDGHSVLDKLRIRLGRFRIPPRELEEMLLQQSLTLQVAADAIENAGWKPEAATRASVLVGLNLDLNTTNFQLRWWLTAQAPRWNVEQGWGLTDAELDAWVAEACDAVQPALSPNRTMGSLGGLVASRIAREFGAGGPSFTVSSDEASGVDALRIAADWLARGEIDAAVVAAVDLASDPRVQLAADALPPRDRYRSGDCAVALVLKRLGDAQRDGDRIYAVLADGADPRLRIEEPTYTLGWTGAAEGLATVATAALAIREAVVPPNGQWARMDLHTCHPCYWAVNRDETPRSAVVATGWPRIALSSVERPAVSTPRPLGPAPIGLFPVFGGPAGLSDLASHLAERPGLSVEALARSWWAATRDRRPGGPTLAFVAADADALIVAVAEAQGDLAAGRATVRRKGAIVEVFESNAVLGEAPARVAFTYPGLGAAYHNMGAEISAYFAELMRELEGRYATLGDQFGPEIWSDRDRPLPVSDHRPAILGQISVGSLMTALFQKLGVRPSAAVGYSLGESAALVSLGAWDDRDESTRRLLESPLFREQLAGPCTVARRVWGLADDEPVDWVAALVPRSKDQVDAAIGDDTQVYVLIRNAEDEVVIGGRGDSVRRVVEALRSPWLPLPTVSTVHCPIGLEVEEAYRELHDLPTVHVEDVVFYSGVWGTGYLPDHGTATSAITAQASRMIDYPKAVEKAYKDGVRVFVEMGPGGGCTRLIGKILGDRPHLAVSADEADGDPLGSLFCALAKLIVAGVPVDLDFLYGGGGATGAQPSGREVVIERQTPPLRMPIAPPRRISTPPIAIATSIRPAAPAVPAPTFEPPPSHAPTMPEPTPAPIPATAASLPPVFRGFLETQQATAGAHEVFLRLSRSYAESVAAIAVGAPPAPAARPVPTAPAFSPPAAPAPTPTRPSLLAPRRPDLYMDRDQCLEYAVGSIAAVLGPEFADADTYPTRVRLPDEPLMLADRIVSVEGTQFELGHGRVVTEHDVLHDGWYLDSGRIAACVAIEAGQADLFLAGWLGIDLVTKGLAVYRLLDATVTFHRPLPEPGAVIRYDIKILNFFRQGETNLFRFEYVATVDGEPLMTMRDGCAGFFTMAELAAGKGIVPRPLDAEPRAGKRPDGWRELAPGKACRLDRAQVEALRVGDLASAFGPPFDGLGLSRPIALPGGRMTLVHRVESLDTAGGRFGLGVIRAEADIHRDDWFMVCHFVDDRVMPGTLMYECCLHTFRILLTRMGWTGESGRVRFEPMTGVANRLRCRGQVTESVRVVTYEITIKEIGDGPEPYAIADALMYADGRPIVEFTDMGLRLAGTDRQELERMWAASRPGSEAASEVVFDSDQILAFTDGKPSDCFGPRYRPYDAEMFIARLPRDPYRFLDRATITEGTPSEQAEGTTVRAEYAVPPDAWYFDSDRQPRVPYGVLLEAALQPCGFVSSFMGSALLSDEPLKYRNLGGSLTQHRAVGRDAGVLTTVARVTKINRSGGMIIHNFDLSVHDRQGVVLEGDTYFGFFHPRALENQVGLTDVKAYAMSDAERAAAKAFPVPDRAPLPDRRWKMVDRVTALLPAGGPNGLGFVAGETDVDPSAWFFQAHFLGDPVWPGSLGLESLLQLLKVFADSRWGVDARTVFASPSLGTTHGWTYRGQIATGSRLVTTQAWITAVDDDRRRVTADGLLSVDGKPIYRMTGYTLELPPG